MPLKVGSRLAHHDVTALIGEGGMGQVYRATDSNFSRVNTMTEPIKQEWVAHSDVRQGQEVWIGHDGKARLTLGFQGVPPTGYNWEAGPDVKAGENRHVHPTREAEGPAVVVRGPLRGTDAPRAHRPDVAETHG